MWNELRELLQYHVVDVFHIQLQFVCVSVVLSAQFPVFLFSLFHEPFVEQFPLCWFGVRVDWGEDSPFHCYPLVFQNTHSTTFQKVVERSVKFGIVFLRLAFAFCHFPFLFLLLSQMFEVSVFYPCPAPDFNQEFSHVSP